MSLPTFAQRGVDSYLQTQIQSRTPLELVVMLYDGALRFSNEAKAAIARKDIPARRNAISRALGIVAELQNTLDMERGGELAARLDGLYSFVSSRLLDATVKQDAQPLDDVVRVLTTLREGWSTIAQRVQAQTPAIAGR